jgi:hypothetical protein
MRMPDMIMSLFASRQIEELHRRLAASQASTLIVVVRLREADSRWSASSSLKPVQRPALLLEVEGSTDWDPGLPSLATGMSLTCLEAVKRGGSGSSGVCNDVTVTGTAHSGPAAAVYRSTTTMLPHSSFMALATFLTIGNVLILRQRSASFSFYRSSFGYGRSLNA